MPTSNDILNEVLLAIRPSNIPPAQKVALNSLRQEVAQFLQQRFPLHHERVGEPHTMGSKEKGTDICFDYDLDLFVPFKYGFKLGPKGMKAAVLSALQERFPNPPTLVRPQRVSIGVRRPFGNHILAIDVVPGMEQRLGQYKESNDKEAEPSKSLLLYDSVSNCERTTNVNRQVRLVKEKMLYYRDTLRLLKAWRSKEKFEIGSYALELLVYQAAIADNAPKTGAHDILLKQALQCSIPFLKADGTLIDRGAGSEWNDFLKPATKIQLAARMKKLLTALEGGDTNNLRSFFP